MEKVTETQTAMRLFYSLNEVGTMLGVTTQSIYERVRHGSIPGEKIGGRWMIPSGFVDELHELSRLRNTPELHETHQGAPDEN